MIPHRVSHITCTLECHAEIEFDTKDSRLPIELKIPACIRYTEKIQHFYQGRIHALLVGGWREQEREPIMGFLGSAPEGSRANAPGGDEGRQGAKPLKLTTCWYLNDNIFSENGSSLSNFYFKTAVMRYCDCRIFNKLEFKSLRYILRLLILSTVL